MFVLPADSSVAEVICSVLVGVIGNCPKLAGIYKEKQLSSRYEQTSNIKEATLLLFT
jgi:hypothetical protein